MAIIKAGTYRFNDVLTSPEKIIDENVNYKVGSTFADGNYYEYELGYFWVGPIVGREERCSVWYAIDDMFADGQRLCVFDNSEGDDLYGWLTENYGDGVKTITISEDTLVSADFYTWFTTNAVEVKTIKAGTYRFNDVLTAPSVVNQEIRPSVGFKFTTTVQGIVVEATCHDFVVCYATEYDEMSLMYGVSTITPDISADAGFSFPNEIYVYSNGWYTDMFGDGCKTITVPYDQDVSEEFYTWFTTNAVEVKYVVKHSTLAAIADSIRAKTGKTDPITPTEMSEEILSIPNEGVDTSDATAASEHILKGYTAYGSDGKVEGSIETYNGEISEGGEIIDPSGECSHEIYDGANSGYSITVAKKVQRPTAEQIANFHEGVSIAYATPDNEYILSIAEASYLENFEIISGLFVDAIYIRTAVTSLNDSYVYLWYFWKESIDRIKAAYAQAGMEVPDFVEGWYYYGDSTDPVIPLTDEYRYSLEFGRFMEFVLPYDNYFYSLFEYYSADAHQEGRKPAKMVIPDGSTHVPLMAYRTEGKLCDTDIVSPPLNHARYTPSLCNEDDSRYEGPHSARSEAFGIGNIQTTIITNVSAEAREWVSIIGHGHDKSGETVNCYLGHPLIMNGTHDSFDFNRDGVYGICVDLEGSAISQGGNLRIENIYTNAIIVEKTDGKVYMSGLPHTTYVVLTIKDVTVAEPVVKKDINFYDYDGTILHSYSLSEAAGLSSLPELPTRHDLICHGWNYDLEVIKARTKPLDIGAMYDYENHTRFYISLTDPNELTVSIRLKICDFINTYMDWGDGGNLDTLSAGEDSTFIHTYSSPGDYVIDVGPGVEVLGGDSSNYTVMGVWSASGSKACHNALWRVDIGQTTVYNGSVKIGQYAFKGCENLKMVNIPSTVTQIGQYAFEGCSSLKHVTLPDTLTSLGSYAFRNCYSLESVVIPNSLSIIPTYAFAYCSALKRVVIPESVSNIGSNAFTSCYSLSEVILPDSLNSLGLGSYAFGYCYAMDKITIPSGVSKIDTNTFYYSRTLKDIVIPVGVTSIGKYAFQYCSALRSVTIEGDITTIDNYAFSNCSGLISLELPGSVATIGTYAFEKCYSLKVLDFTKHTAVPTLSNVNAFSNANENYIVKVPSSLYDSWVAAANWSDIADHIIST